jgi:hypothetical protein
MKKLIITALVLGFGFVGFSQDKGSKETKTTTPDSTMKTKANYNTTRSNKKSIAAPPEGDKKVKTTTKKSSGGKAIKPDTHAILERKKMK